MGADGLFSVELYDGAGVVGVEDGIGDDLGIGGIDGF